MGRFARSGVTGGGGSGGSSSGALTLIETQTLAAPATTITFSSVSNGYADVILIAALRTDGANTGEYTQLQYGATTVQSGASDYHWIRDIMYGTADAGTDTADGADDSIVIGMSQGDSSAAGNFQHVKWEIFQYANAAIDTTVRCEAAGTTDNQHVQGTGGSFTAQAEDIFTISSTSSGDFMIGCTAALYGRGTAA